MLMIKFETLFQTFLLYCCKGINTLHCSSLLEFQSNCADFLSHFERENFHQIICKYEVLYIRSFFILNTIIMNVKWHQKLYEKYYISAKYDAITHVDIAQ